MPDVETKKLDHEILDFIQKYSRTDAPERSFELLAFKVFKHQFDRNANYRKFCLLEKKKPGLLRNWKEIPAMPAAGFKELVLTTFPMKNVVKVFKTSGTTGSASLRGAHFFDSLKLYEASILPLFKKYLIPDDQKLSFYFLISSPDEAPNSSLSHMIGVVNRVFAQGKGKFYIQKDKMKCEVLKHDLKTGKKTALILSTAFSLKSFLDHLQHCKISLRLPKGSRLMETGGFKGRVKEISRNRLYAECEKRLGIHPSHCVSEYGMTELSSQFYDTTLSDKAMKIKRMPFKQGPAWTRTLVINPKTGKEARRGRTGLLRHFDLANRGSVLAIQTEDRGRQMGGGFELLGRASGSELRGCSLSYEEFLSS